MDLDLAAEANKTIVSLLSIQRLKQRLTVVCRIE
jgi:hypothetical protein